MWLYGTKIKKVPKNWNIEKIFWYRLGKVLTYRHAHFLSAQGEAEGYYCFFFVLDFSYLYQ